MEGVVEQEGWVRGWDNRIWRVVRGVSRDMGPRGGLRDGCVVFCVLFFLRPTLRRMVDI